MYTEGNIIYFDPFYFKNNSEAAPKYFLVLKNISGNVILASLPSSKVHLPNFVTISHGCVDIPESCISCYIFQKGIPIAKSGWSFPLNTFLYGNWIDDYSISLLEDKYQIEGIDYEIIGQLTDSELIEVLNCFRKSNIVKRKYRKLL